MKNKLEVSFVDSNGLEILPILCDEIDVRTSGVWLIWLDGDGPNPKQPLQDFYSNENYRKFHVKCKNN